MRIYLASGFSWRYRLRELSGKLQLKNHEITSSWIWIDERPERTHPFWDEFAKAIAASNLIDLHRSNCLVIDARGIRTDGNGGAWSELGFALAKDWPIYLLGPKTNTFLWSEGITWVEDEHELVELKL